LVDARVVDKGVIVVEVADLVVVDVGVIVRVEMIVED